MICIWNWNKAIKRENPKKFSDTVKQLTGNFSPTVE